MKTELTTKVLLGAVLIALIVLIVVFAAKKKAAPIVIEQAVTQETPAQPQAPKAKPSDSNNPADKGTIFYDGSFTGPAGEYSFKVPAGWKAVASAQTGDAMFGPNATATSANGRVALYRNQPSVAVFMQSFSEDTGIEFLEQASVTVNGVPGVSAQYRSTTGDMASFLGLYKNGTVYAISYDRDEPIGFSWLTASFMIK